MANDNFNYTYSAPTEAQRNEIESIRRQYVEGEELEPKEARLHRLHSRVVNTATAAGLIFGVIGLLIFGTGLTCVLEWNNIPLGIGVSVLGAVLIALAYPLYKKVLTKQKAKYGAEIVRLSDELLGEKK